MSDKSSPASRIRDGLALLLVVSGVVSQVTALRHLLPHGIDDTLIFTGFTFLFFGSHFFVPAVLVLIGHLISLGPESWQTPSLVVMAVGIVSGIYGWWRSRKAKAHDEGVA